MTQRYSRDSYSNDADARMAGGSGYGRGGSMQGGYAQNAYARDGYAQSGYSQGGYSQGGYAQSGYTQGSYAQGGYPQNAAAQTGYERGTYSRESYSRASYAGGADARASRSAAGRQQAGRQGGAPVEQRRNAYANNARMADGYQKAARYQGDNRYTGSNGYVSASRDSRSSRRTGAIVAIIALVVVCIGVYTYIHTRPKPITVDGGASVEVAFDTTYQAIVDGKVSGVTLANAVNGDFIAVDNSIITAGGGNAFKVYSDGDEVTDLSARVKKGDVITSERGTNVMEQYTETSETVPWTFDIQDGEDYNFYTGSLTLAVTPGTDGTNLTRTGLTSGITAVSDQSTPMVSRKVIVESYTPTDGSKVVALTFDDGPWPDSTEQIISILQQYGVTGTFFEIGSQIEEYPDISKAVADAGFQVASHGYYHGGGGNDYMNEMTADELQNDLNMSYSIIESTTGETADQIVVRPSGGNFDYQSLLNAGNLVNYYIGWDVDTEDWSKPGVDTIVSNCMGEVFPGAVILMHDGGGDRSETIAALPTIIENLQSQGYTFVTVNQLIQLELTQYAQREAAASTAGSASTSVAAS